MADITLSHITPQHFFETVRLLKMQEHRIYIGVDSIEVRFKQKRFESKEETDKRLEQLEHFMLLELYEMVDIEQTSVDWIDVTYSAHIDSESIQKQLISFFQNIHLGQTRRTRHNKEYDTTAEWNSGSEHRILKVYLKGNESPRTA